MMRRWRHCTNGQLWGASAVMQLVDRYIRPAVDDDLPNAWWINRQTRNAIFPDDAERFVEMDG